jgi:anti-anti-sigma factor
MYLSRPEFSLDGDLDLATAAEYEKYLFKDVTAGDGPVRIDCTRLTFCDSSGIAMLIRLAQATQGRLQLVNVPGNCLRVFEIAGVTETFGLLSDSL